jgi:mono/diheme cytochrome c family protein
MTGVSRIGESIRRALSRPARPLTAGGLVVSVVLGAIALGAAYLAAAPFLEIGGVLTPPLSHVEVVRLGQGWGKDQAAWYHHTSQGTRILPYAWFMALEQPVLTPLRVGRFADRRYLARFGFLYDETRPDPDDDDLPVGFAVEERFSAPYAKPPVREPTRVVGLTCAACHTGRLDVATGDGRIKGVLIEGGSAMINLASFQDATGKALYYTTFFRERFNRFARGVLTRDLPDGDPAKEALRTDLEAYVSTGLATENYAKEHKLMPLEAGFARTDALGLIGNRVFGVLAEENQVVTDAPVNFPHLWDTAWFDWVQYNASIRTPLARNVGEALGVGAVVNLNDTRWPLYGSTVNVPNLVKMEDLLGGPDPFSGLQPPRWDDLLTAAFGSPSKAPAPMVLNREMAEQGRALYREHCAGCHMPPRDELRAALDKGDFSRFTEADPGSGKRFLKLPVIDMNVIGTDPNQALNFYRRVAVSLRPEPREPRAGGPGWAETISAEDGLFRVTSFVRRQAFQGLRLLAPPSITDEKARRAFDFDPKRKAERLRLDRFRSVSEALDEGDQAAIETGAGKRAVIVANLGYKARPLDGIWATPPYFHNGSVPNLYQVLLPASCRDARVWLGTRRFDPKHVGYETGPSPGASEMDTALAGNHNTGHEYRDLTLEELEASQGLTWDGRSNREDRSAFVLGATRADLDAWTARERRAKEREASAEALKRRPIKGVLGPAFSDEERWRLVEYLKTF